LLVRPDAILKWHRDLMAKRHRSGTSVCIRAVVAGLLSAGTPRARRPAHPPKPAVSFSEWARQFTYEYGPLIEQIAEFQLRAQFDPQIQALSAAASEVSTVGPDAKIDPRALANWGLAGTNGRICSVSSASSRTISTRRQRSRARNIAAAVGSAATGYLLAATTLAAFTAGLAWSRRRGDEVRCRCFGSAGGRVDTSHLVRNALLVLIALAGLPALVLAGRPPALGGAGLAIGIGAVVGLLAARWDDLAFVLGSPGQAGATDRLDR
jgi:hypothetical protein